MRVLMTTDTIGGVWTFTQELVAGLLEEGCAVSLLGLGREPSGEQAAWAEQMKQQSPAFDFHGSDVALEWMEGNARASLDAVPLLTAIAHDFRPDVIHANQFCFGATRLPFPKLITAHSDVLTWSEACRQTPLEDSQWLTHYRLLVREGLQGADAVVAPTHWMLDALACHFELPSKRFVIANGRSIHPSIAPKKLQAVTAGRLWDLAKGIALLKDVVSPMPLLVAGEVACESASAPDVLGSACLLGRMDQASLLTLFEQSAVYICTSRYEPFGLAPLEAALCGCAVLAHDLPSLREVWGDSALFFQTADDLSVLLHKLYGDPDLLRHAQARCNRCASEYTREAMTESYLNLYESLRQPVTEMAHVA